MAYYSGVANNVNELLTALRNSAVADGWTLTGDVLGKDTMHVETLISYGNVKARAGLDGAMTSPCPWQHIGYVLKSTQSTPCDITYPCNWEFHGHAQEVYFVVNFAVDRYQFLAWGKSTVPGLPGVGTWIGATVGYVLDENQPQTPTNTMPITIYAYGGGGLVNSNYGYISAALFGTSTFGYETGNVTPCYVHHDLDGYGWRIEPSSSSTYHPFARQWIATTGNTGPYAKMQPSAWNAESALLPLRCYFRRPSSMLSLIVDCEHARLLRIDNLTPGDVLTLGSDKWKVYPWHRKNTAERDGGHAIDHTGTFGWAIRYLGAVNACDFWILRAAV
jgi:hypothetical protein